MMTFHSPTVSGKSIQIPWFQSPPTRILLYYYCIHPLVISYMAIENGPFIYIYGKKKSFSHHQPEDLRKSSQVVSFWAKRHDKSLRLGPTATPERRPPERRPEKPLPLSKKRRKVPGFKPSKLKNEEFIIMKKP